MKKTYYRDFNSHSTVLTVLKIKIVLFSRLQIIFYARFVENLENWKMSGNPNNFSKSRKRLKNTGNVWKKSSFSGLDFQPKKCPFIPTEKILQNLTY